MQKKTLAVAKTEEELCQAANFIFHLQEQSRRSFLMWPNFRVIRSCSSVFRSEK